MFGGWYGRWLRPGESYWKKEEPGRHYAVVAFLGFMLAISAITLGSGLSEVADEYHFYSINGIIFLGWPLMIYLILQKAGYQTIGQARLLGLVAIGALSAVIPLCINPLGDWSMWLAPLTWVWVLSIWGQTSGTFCKPAGCLPGRRGAVSWFCHFLDVSRSHSGAIFKRCAKLPEYLYYGRFTTALSGSRSNWVIAGSPGRRHRSGIAGLFRTQIFCHLDPK